MPLVIFLQLEVKDVFESCVLTAMAAPRKQTITWWVGLVQDTEQGLSKLWHRVGLSKNYHLVLQLVLYNHV